MSKNTICVLGRLGADCKVSTTDNGTALVSFPLASDFGYGERKGTNWFRVTQFGKAAEGKLPEYLLKGALVMVMGELSIREYKDKEGVMRTSVDITAHSIALAGSKPAETAAPDPEPPVRRPAKAPAKAPAKPATGVPAGFDDDIPF